MKKTYSKPVIEVSAAEQTQMLCSSTIIYPGEPNTPAGAHEISDWGDGLGDDEEYF